MKVERIEVRLVRLPLRFPFETSFGRTTHKEFLLVSVSAGGVTGHGECVADVDPYYLPETNGTAAPRPLGVPGPPGPRDESPIPATTSRLRPRARPRDGQGRAGDGGLGAVGAAAGRAALPGAGRAGRRDRRRRLGRTAEGRGRPGGQGRGGSGGRLPPRQDQDQARPGPGPGGGGPRAVPRHCP